MKKANNYFHHDDGHHHGGGHHGDGRHHGEGVHHKNRTGGGFGPNGLCVCLKCGYSMKHQRGIKCTTLKCPDCGHVLARKELVDQKKANKNQNR